MIKYIVVDDEELERKAIQFMIKKHRLPLVCVGEAAQGAQAISLARETWPQLVFMDIKMPGIDGLEAAQKILEFSSATQIVFITAYDQFEYARKGLCLGAVDYLLKPVNPGMILETCERAIKRIEAQPLSAMSNNTGSNGPEQFSLFAQKAQIFSILNSQWTNPTEKISDLFTDFRSGTVLVIGQPDQTIPSQAIQQALKEVVRNYPYFFLIPGSPHPALVLLGGSQHQPLLTAPKMKMLAKEVLERVKKNCQEEAMIGIGRYYPQLIGLRLAHLEALYGLRLAQDNRGINPIYHFNELESHLDRGHIEKILGENISSVNTQQAALQLLGLYKKKLALLVHPNCSLVGAMALQLLSLLVQFLGDEQAPEGLRINLDFADLALKTGTPEAAELKKQLLPALEDLVKLIVKSREIPVSQAVQTVQNYIENNLEKPISLEAMSRLVHLNSQYFSRHFKAQTGVTFLQYVNERRMEAAKYLLKEEGLPIYQVAKKVGFVDANYFSRVFKKLVGINARDYCGGN